MTLYPKPANLYTGLSQLEKTCNSKTILCPNRIESHFCAYYVNVIFCIQTVLAYILLMDVFLTGNHVLYKFREDKPLCKTFSITNSILGL